MTNKKIIEGLIQCHSLLTEIRKSPSDVFAAGNLKETVSNAVWLVGEFDTGPDPERLSDLKKATIINLYMVLKTISAGKTVAPAGGQSFSPLDEVIDRMGLFLCVASEYCGFPAITSPPAYLPCVPAPSGFFDSLPQGNPLI
jgi:hypothetical protein